MAAQLNNSRSSSDNMSMGYYTPQQPQIMADPAALFAHHALQTPLRANLTSAAHAPNTMLQPRPTPEQYEARISYLKARSLEFLNQASLHKREVTRLQAENTALRATLERAQAFNRASSRRNVAAGLVRAPQGAPQPINNRKRAFENDGDDEVVITAVNAITPATTTTTPPTSGSTSNPQNPPVATNCGGQQQEQQRPTKKPRTADPGWLTTNSDPKMLLARGKINPTRAQELRHEQVLRTEEGRIAAGIAARGKAKRPRVYKRKTKETTPESPRKFAEWEGLLHDRTDEYGRPIPAIPVVSSSSSSSPPPPLPSAPDVEAFDAFLVGGGDEEQQQEDQTVLPTQEAVGEEGSLPVDKEKEAEKDEDNQEEEEEEDKDLEPPDSAGQVLDTIDAARSDRDPCDGFDPYACLGMDDEADNWTRFWQENPTGDFS